MYITLISLFIAFQSPISITYGLTHLNIYLYYILSLLFYIRL